MKKILLVLFLLSLSPLCIAQPIVLTSSSPNGIIEANSQSITVYGTKEPNSIIVKKGAKAELINFPGENIITFESATSNFKVFRSGATVSFLGDYNTTLKIPATSQSQTINFTDTSGVLKIESDQVMLNDQKIITSAKIVAFTENVEDSETDNEFVFILTNIGELTENTNEVIEGNMSVKGTYLGNNSYNAFLHSNYGKLFLSPFTTYKLIFDYKILETPDRGFETIFYSPTGGEANDWLPGEEFTGEKGDSGSITLINTLSNYNDYQVRWNIVGNGSIVVDNIIITDLDKNQTIVNEKINVKYYTVDEKIKNKPSVPVFYPWSEYYSDTISSPYSLIWTTSGLAEDIESTQPSNNSYMRIDKNTLDIIAEEWHYWCPEWRTLSSNSKFYLDELFESHINSEYCNNLVINFEHPEWPNLLAEKALNFKKAGFNGIFFDWWHNGAGNGRAKEDVKAARLSIAKTIREKVGDDFIIMGNVNWEIDDPTAQYISGVFLELWKPYPNKEYALSYNNEEINSVWNPSIERMEILLTYWNDNLQWPKIIAFEPWKITTGDYVSDRYTEENYKYAKLFTAMALVIPENGYILYSDNNDDWNGGDHQHAYYDFYHTDLGKPVSGRVEVIEGVAYKQYEKGFVIYNRTNSEADVILPNGEQIKINSLEGLFLDNF